MKLCIDIGNTATKIFSFKDNKEIDSVITNTNKKCQEGEHVDVLKKFKDVNQIIFSSVVPEVSNKVKIDIKTVFGNDINVIEIGPGVKTGVNISVPHPKEVGSDIVAQAVGALEVTDGPVLVIGMGTATVFILIDEKRRIIGASFIPGLELAMKSLSVATSKLMSVELNEVKEEFGVDTQSAIQTGLVFSQVGAIEKMCSIAKQKFSNVNIILSGGYGSMISNHLSDEIKQVPNLTIMGLRKIGELNEL